MANPQNPYMTTREVAGEYPVKEPTLRAWRSANQGPPSYTSGPNGRVYYKRSEVADWFARQEAASRRGDAA
ncbi:helix-turn-helix transcriptional regulator [Mycobacteroides immunogenum]|uniref:helix-turn-helix transcriptional regulator n=1 Tax=Mycobacteroides immunogenum TaxID=83262 RepID=UPI000A61AF0A|nr:helix-turn-helix domain-containing protein [Mycobacteroides immunogenum]